MPSYKIVMNFKNSGGKNTTMSFSDARPDVTQAEAMAVMDTILAANVFQPDGIQSFIRKSFALSGH